MQTIYSFPKTERLKSRKLLANLFEGGNSFLIHPIKVFYSVAKNSSTFPVRAGVGVSSRNFKHAVDRNRIKRLLKEGYRLNKSELLLFADQDKIQVSIFFLYIDKSLPNGLSDLQIKMQLIIDKLIVILHENATPIH